MLLLFKYLIILSVSAIPVTRSISLLIIELMFNDLFPNNMSLYKIVVKNIFDLLMDLFLT